MIKIKKIELDAPDIGELEKEYLLKALNLGYVSSYGPYVSEFEETFAKYLGVKAAAAVQSGTAALHLALYELGIGPGDEVIVPVLTFVATVNPVMYLGATPVFVDVDPETWNINPEQVERAITPRTKAIIPVHLYGNPANMNELLYISRKYGIPIIEDATESLGSKFKGKFTGTFGKFGCFSFNGNKIITTGGGGMIVSNDEKAIEHIKFLADQAKDIKRGYYHPEIGFNYRMTNIEAALGLAQLQRLKEFLFKKKKIFEIYKKELSDIRWIKFQKEYRYAESNRWITSIVLNKNGNGIDINDLQKLLKKRGIPTRRIFTPIIEFPPYRQFANGDYRIAYNIAYNIYKKGLNLPSSTFNQLNEIKNVAMVLKEIVLKLYV